MLSFELSAMDLILAVAVIILLVLYMRKPSPKTPAQKELVVERETASEKIVTEAAMSEPEIEKPMSTQPQTGSVRCLFGFGYLKKLDKGAPIPDECLGCSRIMECRSANE